MKKEIRDFLEEHNIKHEIVGGEITVGGSLFLPSLTSIPEGFNPTVGGNLYLSV